MFGHPYCTLSLILSENTHEKRVDGIVTSSKLVLLRNKLWKEWNYGKTGKEKYPEAKKKGSTVAFQAKSKAERRRFGNAMQRDNKKYDVFKIEKKEANHE